jgi:hypothetical protein
VIEDSVAKKEMESVAVNHHKMDIIKYIDLGLSSPQAKKKSCSKWTLLVN